MIEILCPRKKGDLQTLVQFLYDGEIHCDNENEYHEINNNLNKIFGFPDNMYFQYQEKLNLYRFVIFSVLYLKLYK